MAVRSRGPGVSAVRAVSYRAALLDQVARIDLAARIQQVVQIDQVDQDSRWQARENLR